MNLSIIRDGHRFPYSVDQLRKDNPQILFPRDLSNYDLSPYGVIVEQPEEVEKRKDSTGIPKHRRIAMHRFLWGLRCFNIRTQFERYILALEGHARDYWQTAPYVVRSSTYVKHFAEIFALSEFDLDAIFSAADSIEE